MMYSWKLVWPLAGGRYVHLKVNIIYTTNLLFINSFIKKYTKCHISISIVKDFAGGGARVFWWFNKETKEIVAADCHI